MDRYRNLTLLPRYLWYSVHGGYEKAHLKMRKWVAYGRRMLLRKIKVSNGET